MEELGFVAEVKAVRDGLGVAAFFVVGGEEFGLAGFGRWRRCRRRGRGGGRRGRLGGCLGTGAGGRGRRSSPTQPAHYLIGI